MKKNVFFSFIVCFFLVQTSFAQIILDPLDPGGGTLYTWYRDADGDGLGDPNVFQLTSGTKPPVGYVSNPNDCNDSDSAIGLPTWWYKDFDGDGFGFITYNHPNPGDPILIDENGNPIEGFGTLENSDAIKACVAPPGYVSNSNDCNDRDNTITYLTWYYDADGDGYGDANNTTTSIIQMSCTFPPFGYSSRIDCDDNDPLLNPATIWYHDLNGDGFYDENEPTFRGCIPPNSNYEPLLDYSNYNWTHNISYDNLGNVQSASRVYFDEIGRARVSLSKDYLNNKVWGTESVYDDYGRILKTSFPTVSDKSFKKIDFLSNPLSKQQYLDPYYNDSNTLNPYQATASHPYTEVEYDKLNPGNIIKSFGGNQINNEWKSGYTYTVPAAQEMYYLFGHNFYDGTVVGGKEEIITQFYKTVTVDVAGVENVQFSDGEGKLLATARSGSSTSINPYQVHSLIGTQGFVDVHIPSGITSGITLIGGASQYKVYDLKTGLLTTAPLTGGNAYRIEAIATVLTNPKVYVTQSTGALSYDIGAKGISYPVNYYDYAINIYDKTGRLKKQVQPNGFRSVYSATPATFTIVAAPAYMSDSFTNFSTTNKYNTLNQIIETKNPDEGTTRYAYRKDGAIRFSQNAIQVSFNKISYIEYDQYGRVIENGVISGINWTDIGLYVDSVLPTGPSITKSEQTFVVYDYHGNYQGVTPPANDFASFGLNSVDYKPNNLAGNIVASYNNETSSWYSYDIYGRVEWMVQNSNGLGLKTIHYEYDVYGNVKRVIYQKNTSDLFEHFYTYNLNGQLVKVETSRNGGALVTNAEYSYYIDGTLKRKNIANGLQGLDYVYTLGGMLKSINHPSLSASNDPGGDSNDVFGVILDYYDGDYNRPSKPRINTSPVVSGANSNYYNGNIKAMRYANKLLDSYNGTIQQKAFVYNYNNQNWLTNARYGTASSTASIILSGSNTYNEGGITYDSNGNITKLSRRSEAGVLTDNLTYVYDYNSGKNQLNSLIDEAAPTPDPSDIENQAPNNYGYNAIGQMISNVQENLTYEYNSLGLVSRVKKGGVTQVEFYYNERGQRYKKVTPTGGGVTEYYVNDASGNTMAIYLKQGSATPQLKELAVYGEDRIGVLTAGAPSFYQYEITDHLGNVRAVIRKPSGGGSIPTINSYADYYPFGEVLPYRNAFDNYRYAFQGQEKDSETGMEAFKLRLWDGRIGRWLSPDPYGQHFSPYLGMGNNPVRMIDPDGGWCFDAVTNMRIPCGDTNSNYEGPTVESLYINQRGLDEVMVVGKPKNKGSNFMASFNWQYRDPFPNTKWRFFERHKSGSRLWGTMTDGTYEFGDKRGKYSVLYKSYDMKDFAIPLGGGRTPISWAHKANVIPHLTRTTKIGVDGVVLAHGLVTNSTIEYKTVFRKANYTIDLPTKSIDSTFEYITSWGDYNYHKRKKDSLDQNTKEQRRTALIWNFDE